MRQCKDLIAMGLCSLVLPTLAATTQYDVTFEGRWTSDLPRPGNAHFTTLAGATHNQSGSLLMIGQAASSGVKDVAETGSTLSLDRFLRGQIRSGLADQFVLGTDGFISPEETNTFTIIVDDAFPLLTLITMIAPSPDWFTGVHDLSLIDTQGDWIPQLVLDLASYDAGTEEGSGLSLNNPATNPVGVIAPLDVAEPTGALFGAGSIARLTLTRLLPGDTDSDGDVDDSDLGTSFANYTGPVGAAGGRTFAQGDTDGDGDVDDSDLGSSFAAYTGPQSPAAVPEPGSLALLGLAGIALVSRRRR